MMVLPRRTNAVLARVYLAHELCHVLFDPSDGGLHIVLDVGSDRDVQAAEQRARAFAAELLLPLPGRATSKEAGWSECRSSTRTS